MVYFLLGAMNRKRRIRLYIDEKCGELITPAYFEMIAGVSSTKGKLSKSLIEERRKDKESEKAR